MWLGLIQVYRCEFCDGCFHEALKLKQHRQKEHVNPDAPNAYTCSVCGAQFSTYARVTTHKLSHGISTETLIVPDEGKIMFVWDPLIFYSLYKVSFYWLH